MEIIEIILLVVFIFLSVFLLVFAIGKALEETKKR